MKINIPESSKERIVIIGGGFAGIAAARSLAHSGYQIVLIDKNNYHQFQPLFYQVAMAGLEPSSIVFPFRKLFRKKEDLYIRVTEVESIDTVNNRIITSLGHCNYDHLIIAVGANTNYYGNKEVEQHALPMKSVGEALQLRNEILSDYEKALSMTDFNQRQGYIDIVIVGGGPTGVELAGALAEMKEYILPKDYPELNCEEIDIYLIQSAPQLLKGMSDNAAQKALEYLQDAGVNVRLNTRVNRFDGEYAYLNDNSVIPCRKVIWAAGIRGNSIPGLPNDAVTYGNRLAVDKYSKIINTNNIYAIGDIAYMATENSPKGHPQVAQVAIQQGALLAKNFKRQLKQQKWLAFEYDDKGSMATIGRNKAVVDLAKVKFHGFFAWTIWLLVHLFSILGTKNKVFVFLNWVWNYITYDQSLRLIIKTKYKPEKQ